MPFLLLRSRIFNLLQVILCSEVKARLHVKDIWLDLQSGFEHIGKGDGRPSSNLFPLVIAPSSRAGILFIIRLSGTTGKSVI
jgi:trafficking protein particle complex subunit 10